MTRVNHSITLLNNRIRTDNSDKKIPQVFRSLIFFVSSTIGFSGIRPLTRTFSVLFVLNGRFCLNSAHHLLPINLFIVPKVRITNESRISPELCRLYELYSRSGDLFSGLQVVRIFHFLSRYTSRSTTRRPLDPVIDYAARQSRIHPVPNSSAVLLGLAWTRATDASKGPSKTKKGNLEAEFGCQTHVFLFKRWAWTKNVG